MSTNKYKRPCDNEDCNEVTVFTPEFFVRSQLLRTPFYCAAGHKQKWPADVQSRAIQNVTLAVVEIDSCHSKLTDLRKKLDEAADSSEELTYEKKEVQRKSDNFERLWNEALMEKGIRERSIAGLLDEITLLRRQRGALRGQVTKLKNRTNEAK